MNCWFDLHELERDYIFFYFYIYSKYKKFTFQNYIIKQERSPVSDLSCLIM